MAGAELQGTISGQTHSPSMMAALHFLGGFLANPLGVASPFSSGPVLASAIAAQIARGSRAVLELGPGTGAVTRAILARGVAPSGLVAIESDKGFAGILRKNFQAARILEGDAFQFSDILKQAGVRRKFDAIVSGVPVLTQSESRRGILLRAAMAALRPRAPFIQFSYADRSPFPDSPDVTGERADKIWRNLPPLNIWVYRRAG